MGGYRRGALMLVVIGLLTVNAAAAMAAVTSPPIIRVSPALDPAFNVSTPNYVTRCIPQGSSATTGTVEVYVRARGNEVSVDGGTAQEGVSLVSVSLAPGQGIPITVGTGASATTYTVRCLPPNFPGYRSTVSGTTQASFYLLAPNFSSQGSASGAPFVIMFDSHGVPVWWYSSPDGVPIDADVDPNGDLSWAVEHGNETLFGVPGSITDEVRTLDGQLVYSFGTNQTPPDLHELWPLANGDFLIDSYVPAANVPISIPGLPATENVLNASFQEVDPSTGQTLYTWNSSGHINPSDSANCSYCQDPYPGLTGSYWDWQHINAVQPYENGYLVSFRDTDAIYYIDGTTGNVVWKLGGTYDPGESLQISGDSDKDFGRQHDVRAWPDGTVSVFDNGTDYFRPPRGLRFSIDYTGGPGYVGTATLVQTVTDPDVPFSICCGSFRAVEPDDLTTSDWVITWGATPYLTEDTPSGSVLLRIAFTKPYFSYRGVPITSSQISAAQVQEAMNTMYGSPSSSAVRRWG